MRRESAFWRRGARRALAALPRPPLRVVDTALFYASTTTLTGRGLGARGFGWSPLLLDLVGEA